MGDVDAARALFDAMTAHRNAHSLNAMMAAALQNGLFDDTMVLYDDDDGAHAKDVTSHALAIRICAKLRRTERGRALHGELSDSR